MTQSSIVTKLLTVLTVVSDAQESLTFSQIVQKTGLHKSTIHRLLAIGVEERLLRYDEHRKVYFMGGKVFDLVRGAFNGYDIQAIAMDEMVRLFELFDANITIGVPGGHEVIYLRVLESPRSLGGMQRPGMREPVHCSASGKALLAFYPDKIQRSLLQGYDFTRFTDRTIVSLDDFMSELARVRAQGYGQNDREEYDHFLGISAPIFNYMSEPVGVLNIWSVSSRHTMEDLTGWSAELRRSAARITEMIGGLAPTRF